MDKVTSMLVRHNRLTMAQVRQRVGEREAEAVETLMQLAGVSEEPQRVYAEVRDGRGEGEKISSLFF